MSGDTRQVVIVEPRGGSLADAAQAVLVKRTFKSRILEKLCEGAASALNGIAGSIVWASFRLSEGGARLRDYEYRSAVESVPRRCIAFLVLAAVGALSETVYLILSGNEGRVISAILFFVLKALEILSALALRDIVRKTQWEREAPRSLCSDDESRTEK